ncbi:AFR591C-Ap [Eremothecium gossypii ATCC 10895]|uniref:AFR591C-Ap n=1 Tax=Eremothecium gossypii (strain ATCC 10895 / CBS 109.51 / FGSC 9923 / NRRL Y-1056) TaxID=284811 RepID=D8FGE4_EREGS|nr:AFR591C-Ap [Eremothecium gossypii ATCC 10895]ADJ41793.1 AFR591C-Ap [Eremothecium gossypii ATCC 10895]AEY98276.1 FAFR591C-Ap [Eremothecium gossypii FDAG1]
MDTVNRCKIYSLARFVHPRQHSLDWLAPGTAPRKSVHVVHVVERTMGELAAWRPRTLARLLEGGAVVIVDCVAVWGRAVAQHASSGRIHYVRDAGVLSFSGLLGFLAQLADAPAATLRRRCRAPATAPAPLAAVVLDNISAYRAPPAALGALRRALEHLQLAHGCAVLTVGYGIEYYEGVESSFPTRAGEVGPWPTRLDHAYLASMDAVVVPATEKVTAPSADAEKTRTAGRAAVPLPPGQSDVR